MARRLRFICCSFLFIFCFSKVDAQYSLVKTLTEHTAPVNGLDIRNDEQFMLSCSKDCGIIIWDLSQFIPAHILKKQSNSIKKVLYSTSGDKFYATTYKDVLIYNLNKLNKYKKIKAHNSFVESISLSRTNGLVATTGWRDHSIEIWKEDGFKKQTSPKDSIWSDCSLFSLDGKFLFTGDHQNLIKIWDVNTGDLVERLAGHSDWIYDLELSLDGKTLYSGSFDGSVKIWDTDKFKNTGTLKGHTDGIVCIDLSADGAYLVSAGMDKSIIVWDLKNQKELYKIDQAHEGSILDVKFINGHKRIISAGSDHSIKVWDLKDNQ